MPETLPQQSFLFASLPAWLVVVLSCGLVAAWVWVHLHKGKKHIGKGAWVAALGRILLGTLSIVFVFHTLSFSLTLATPWSWWWLGLLGATLLEGVLSLYEVERTVAPAKISRTITALRVVTLCLVLLILAEPVLERYIDRTLDRIVVLLVDQSQSMELTDPQRDPAEWIELGIFKGILKAKDYAPDGKMREKVSGKSTEDFFALLEPEERDGLKKLEGLKRSELLKQVLRGVTEEESGILALLKKNYDVRLVRFASSPNWVELNETPNESNPDEIVEESASPVLDDWKRLTNLTQALEYPMENIPPDQLAGVVVLSDHRDTSRGNPESPATQLANRGVPVYPVLLGSRKSRNDLAVTGVDAPESIFKGERLSIDVNLKLYGVAGMPVKVKFLRGETLLKEETVQVPQGEDQFRTMLKFRDEPEEDGILAYSVRVQEMQDEVILENNRWDFQTAVSEDRTNVLLLDTRPRWEFRYLRNLFYGRDKSVHLQYVLTEPDSITSALDQELNLGTRPQIEASASRPFGDAEATLLPTTREEWRKFDIIILGDLSPEILTPAQLDHIDYCVRERGAALVVIAGPMYLPHKFDSPILQKLLPIRYDRTMGAMQLPPEPSYRLEPTLEGRRHPIMQLGNSISESDQVWEDQPSLKWRYQTAGIKPGATVLAYALPSDVQEMNFTTADLSPKETAARIKEMNAIKERNNLIVLQSYGLGRVLMLNYDRTWRLRYRIGDTLHHRFWGRIMTWGAGENLRAGNEFVRLGTDAITYSPDDKIKVTARILQSDYIPVTGESFNVDVYHQGVKIATHTLQYREDSQGMYDAEIGPFSEPGIYPIRLVSSPKSKVRLDGAGVVETEFRVATAFNPVEMSEFSADFERAQRIAKIGGTDLLSLQNLDALKDAFGPGSKKKLERADVTLWDHWLLFVLIVSLITAEWLLRRKGGLL